MERGEVTMDIGDPSCNEGDLHMSRVLKDACAWHRRNTLTVLGVIFSTEQQKVIR